MEKNNMKHTGVAAAKANVTHVPAADAQPDTQHEKVKRPRKLSERSFDKKKVTPRDLGFKTQSLDPMFPLLEKMPTNKREMEKAHALAAVLDTMLVQTEIKLKKIAERQRVIAAMTSPEQRATYYKRKIVIVENYTLMGSNLDKSEYVKNLPAHFSESLVVAFVNPRVSIVHAVWLSDAEPGHHERLDLPNSMKGCHPEYLREHLYLRMFHKY